MQVIHHTKNLVSSFVYNLLVFTMYANSSVNFYMYLLVDRRFRRDFTRIMTNQIVTISSSVDNLSSVMTNKNDFVNSSFALNELTEAGNCTPMSVDGQHPRTNKETKF